MITADIPLAAEVIEKGAAALNPRGERYSPATIRERLTMRDLWIRFAPAACKPAGQTACPSAIASSSPQSLISGCSKSSVALRNDNHCHFVVQYGLRRVVIPYRFAVK